MLVGDESVVTKAGKQSHGLDRFFSSIFNKPVAGLAFFALSLVSVAERKSYPLQVVEQVLRSAAEKAATKAKKVTQKGKSSAQPGKSGRRKGSQNKDKREIEWSAELQRIKAMATTLLQRVRPLRYFMLSKLAKWSIGNELLAKRAGSRW